MVGMRWELLSPGSGGGQFGQGQYPNKYTDPAQLSARRVCPGWWCNRDGRGVERDGATARRRPDEGERLSQVYNLFVYF